MSDLPLEFPFRIGQPVYHRCDRTKTAGVVLGAITLTELVLVLVHWRDAASTFEAFEDLLVRLA